MLSPATRRYALGVLTVVYTFNFIDRQIMSILLPAIRTEFGVNDTVLGLLAGTAFAVFYVTLGLPIARIADRSNRRDLVTWSVAVWSGMTALSGLSHNIWHLALARIGVGVGEAGFSPAAHSMIADYYPPKERSTAMGVFTLGISAGIMVAFMAGGWVAQNIGWREAFYIVGLPGLLLAFLVRFTVPEPERGASEARADSGRQPTLAQVIAYLRLRKSALHMGIGAGLSAFAGYSVLTFLVEFLVRSFGMDTAGIGFRLGPIVGIAGGAGFFFGGFIADRVGRSGQRKAFNFLAVSMLVAALANVAVFLSTTLVACLVLLVAPLVIANFYLAPVLAFAQGLVSLRMRAITSAIVLLVINTIGLALGPFFTGLLSDLLKPWFGMESLRYSLLLVCVIVLPWSAWHYWRAGRTIEADLARAREND